MEYCFLSCLVIYRHKNNILNIINRIKIKESTTVYVTVFNKDNNKLNNLICIMSIVFKLTVGVFMSDNLPDMYTSESDADDHTLERSDSSLDIHALEISSTCNNKESILKKSKLIRNFGITSFSFMGVIILLIIIDIIVAQSSTPNYPNSSAVFSISISILVLDSIFSIANLVFMILAIVKIASTD